MKNKKGRVLFIASVYTHLAAFHKPFLRFLQDQGYSCHAAASSAEGFKEDIQALGITCWEIPFARSPYSLKNLIAYVRLKELLLNEHFDLVHVHTPMAAFLGRYLAKTTRQGAVLYTAHGFHFYRNAPLYNRVVYYSAEWVAARWTDGLIVMNSEDFEAGKKLGFIPRKNLYYIHGVGVDLKAFIQAVPRASLKEELGIGNNDVIVTCVGEFTPGKNHAFLLEAWKKLTAENKFIRLLLIGKGEMQDKLKTKIEKEQIPQVHLLGFCHNVPDLLQISDIFTLVSKREGLPKSIMEAMAAGKPVVATNVRGSWDLVEHGRTGLLVKPGDVDGLVSALKKLIVNPGLRSDMGMEGQKKIQEYSLEKILAEMAAIYACYLDLTPDQSRLDSRN